MLVLTRKEGEAVLIGGSVLIHVLRLRGGRVRVGIEAPREVTVHREELLNQGAVSNVAATISDGLPSRTREDQQGT